MFGHRPIGDPFGANRDVFPDDRRVPVCSAVGLHAGCQPEPAEQQAFRPDPFCVNQALE